ncbi:hypothetical protein C6V83_05275 [Gordonia iterans]|uniref:DUF3558 domain-containing protein n=1 Tax=Gordonia iterans TaxID=1004901 RepID=A0A2S0KDP7_9ACTN|nr:hypothetical protein [Gordonia iterans]AVL99775.1 hypothetical protein C6V83_05275 [Gordonia iterans]
MNLRHLPFAAAAVAVLAVAGCSDDDRDTGWTPNSPTANAPAPASQSTTTAAAKATEDTVIAAFEALGYQCSPEQQMTFCVQGGENWQIRTSPAGDGDKAFAKSVCDAGMGDDGRVLTNGDVVIYAGNKHQDLATIQTTLEAKGVSGLDVVDHCP